MNDYDASVAMINLGGSFVQTLGLLYQLADDTNQQRLRDAFPDYFAEYRELARLHAERVKAHD